jgi:hypothetical protein
MRRSMMEPGCVEMREAPQPARRHGRIALLTRFCIYLQCRRRGYSEQISNTTSCEMRKSCCPYGPRRTRLEQALFGSLAWRPERLAGVPRGALAFGPTIAPALDRLGRVATASSHCPLNRRSGAALGTCGSAHPLTSVCGVVFHTRTYRDLIRPEFQNLVAFNAASSSTVLAAPPQFAGVTATLFPFVPCCDLFSLILFHWQPCCCGPVSPFFFSYLRLVYRLWIAFCSTTCPTHTNQ